MNANKTRQMLVNQKLKAETLSKPLTPNDKLPKLTAEQRRELYAPKPATSAPQHLQGDAWVNGWQQTQRPRRIVRATKATAKAGGWFVVMLTAIAGGILVGESKRGLYS